MRQLRCSRDDCQQDGGTGLLWVTVLLLLVAGLYGEEPTLVIENARVIVGNGTVLDGATVVITRDRIEKVSTENPQPNAGKRIDAHGRTLMPGLIDTHVHFFGLTAQGEAGFRAQIKTLAPEYLKEFLRHGVTTVKSLADPLDLVLELRTLVNEGKLRWRATSAPASREGRAFSRVYE